MQYDDADEPAPGAPRDAGVRGGATERAVQRIREPIIEGKLGSGARISEREMCERFSLSRTPVREALKVLAAEGLVTLTPNRGAIVTRLTAQDVDHVYEVLVGLEGIAAERICARVTDQQLGCIRALHDKMVAHHNAGERLDYFYANQAIHQAIVDGAGNASLSRIYAAESRRIWRFRFAGNLDAARWDAAVREHAQILEALEARECALLRELMRYHLQSGWRLVRRQLEGK